MSLDELIDKCKKCRDCRLRKHASQVVPGTGSAKANILFIGEAPGSKEDERGIPFCGPAGEVLDELLAEIGLDRKDIFITNIVKCRPPSNRDPLEDEIRACRKWTNRFIKQIDPKIFVLLGRFAMQKFFPKFKISNVHGNIYKKWGRYFMLMYHPAVALYDVSKKEELRNDFLGLVNFLRNEYDKVIELEDSVQKIKNLMRNNRANKRKKKKQLRIKI